jgi:hypothetical protein
MRSQRPMKMFFVMISSPSTVGHDPVIYAIRHRLISELMERMDVKSFTSI